MSMTRSPCAWSGRFEALAQHDTAALASLIAREVSTRGGEQFAAWVASIDVMKDAAAVCMRSRPEAASFAAVLEFELPRDDRRPDVIVLENGTVVVIEFKSVPRATRADRDQVRAYARDLTHYHSSCRDRRLLPILVPLGYSGPTYDDGGVTVIAPGSVAATILRGALSGPLTPPDTAAWLSGTYAPLPGLAAAARALFAKQPLPRIKRAASAGVPGVVDRLVGIAANTAATGGRTIAFVTGVPGAGKTLVGLQLVHAEPPIDRPLLDRLDPAPAVFLSGNDPLVEVLRYTLRSTAFVQSLKHYLREHAGSAAPVPPEHLIVFDEAQRAWDAKKVLAKHRGLMGAASEPELLVRIAGRIPEWSMIVALVGEGQEIHVGEESGLASWCEALAERPDWRVFAPPRIASALDGCGIRVQPETSFNLDTSLRSHVAGRVHEWVASFLDGRMAAARAIVPELDGWDLYVSRDLDAIRRYTRARYSGQRDRRYGLLISSCADNCRGIARRIKEDGVNTGYGPWYEGGRTARHRAGPNFCCSLTTAVSEFGCQGLELDFSVLCWGDDLSWVDGRWTQVDGKRRIGAKNRQRLRLNAYRVLLTRARDGMCIFVPPEPTPAMHTVFEACVAAGVPVLPDA